MDRIAKYIQAKQTFVVEFYAEWCGPCKVYGPALKKFCSEKGVPLVQLNGDTVPPNSELANFMASIKLAAYPTTLIYKNGTGPVMIVGADLNKVKGVFS